MIRLDLVSVSTETEKVVKKEFSIPVVLITPIIKVKKKGVKTPYLSSGSLWFNQEGMKVLNLLEGETITISEAQTGLFVYNSTPVDEVNEQFKKKLTKTNILRVSAKNIKRIYSDNALNENEAWFFQMVDCVIDLPGVKDAKVSIFRPLEKRA